MSAPQPPAAISKPPPAKTGVTSSLPQPEDVIVPTRKALGRRPKVTAQQIHDALVTFKGSRSRAAEYLNVSDKFIRTRILQNETLRSIWLTMPTPKELQEAQLVAIDPATALEKLVEAHNISLDFNSQRILRQLKNLEKRIELGEQALLNPDDKEAQKFRFQINDKGDPAEEKMLREQYAALLEEFRQTKESVMNQILVKAKVIREMRAGKSNAPKTSRPGFTPKGTPKELTQVVVQPGSNVTINGKS